MGCAVQGPDKDLKTRTGSGTAQKLPDCSLLPQYGAQLLFENMKERIFIGECSSFHVPIGLVASLDVIVVEQVHGKTLGQEA
ncbi:hypothetical protein BTVI_105826 [Pitangus sulphuratus]|nr:hypothetical protein BTVI_105826 [Pitangus sulphuratus]